MSNDVVPNVAGPGPDDGVFRAVHLDEFATLGADGWGALDRLGRALHVKEAGLERTLEAVVATATRTIPGAAAAGLNLYERGRFVPQAIFGAAPHRLDALQQQTGTGPCIDASRDQVTVRIEDATTEARWPDWISLALSLDVLSMLCIPLWVDEQRLGSLSLYGGETHAFGEHESYLAGLFASHAALALSDAQRTENLRRVVLNRDIIGQAKGILMERHRITADQAFTRLSEASQRTNRKLIEIAELVAATGALPDA